MCQSVQPVEHYLLLSEDGVITGDGLQLQGLFECEDIVLQTVRLLLQGDQHLAFRGLELQMGCFLTGISTQKSTEEVQTAVIAVGHAAESMVDGVACYLLAFHLFESRTHIGFQRGIIDFLLTVCYLAILPSRQFLVFRKMQAVTVEQSGLIQQCFQFDVMVQRIAGRQQAVTPVA